MLQQTNIVGELVRAGGDAGDHIHHPRIQFSGIGLAGNRETFLESHLLRNHLICLAALLMVAVEKLEEAGLCTGRTLGAKQLQLGKHVVQI